MVGPPAPPLTEPGSAKTSEDIPIARTTIAARARDLIREMSYNNTALKSTGLPFEAANLEKVQRFA